MGVPGFGQWQGEMPPDATCGAERDLSIESGPMRALPRPERRTAIVALLVVFAACSRTESPGRATERRAAVADTLRSLIVDAYDLSKPGDAVARLMSLYPDTGTVVSASGGQLTTSRDSLQSQLRAFWEYVGRNMREPRWTWGRMHVDLLSDDAAVLTTTYSVAHTTPAGAPHVIAGAWTAVFQRRGNRWVIVQEHLSDVPPPAPSMESTNASSVAPGEHVH